jgi:L-threonylcarbamoyladenylate synthase
MPTIIPFHTGLTPAGYARLAAIVASGGVLAVPTESSYALAVSPFHDHALTGLFKIKRRADGKPILVLIGDAVQVQRLAASVPAAGELLLRSFWPGPLTIIFQAHPSLPAGLTAGTGTVGLRLPAVPVLRRLLVEIGPLTGTSANHSGQPPLCTADDVAAALGEHIDAILDAGPTPGGLPSTVFDARGPLRIIREGRLSRTVLSDQLCRAGFQLSP